MLLKTKLKQRRWMKVVVRAKINYTFVPPPFCKWFHFYNYLICKKFSIKLKYLTAVSILSLIERLKIHFRFIFVINLQNFKIRWSRSIVCTKVRWYDADKDTGARLCQINKKYQSGRLSAKSQHTFLTK